MTHSSLFKYNLRSFRINLSGLFLGPAMPQADEPYFESVGTGTPRILAESFSPKNRPQLPLSPNRQNMYWYLLYIFILYFFCIKKGTLSLGSLKVSKLTLLKLAYFFFIIILLRSLSNSFFVHTPFNINIILSPYQSESNLLLFTIILELSIPETNLTLYSFSTL